MKPSDLKSATGQTEERKPLPLSSRADPPITHEEAEAAQTSTCCRHNGLIEMTGDKDGTVFFCPIGKQYWRYSKKKRMKPIKYPAMGAV